MAWARFDRHLPWPSFQTIEKRDAMETLRIMIEAEHLTPIVGRTFPLSEAPSAIRFLQEGQVCGRIVIVP